MGTIGIVSCGEFGAALGKLFRAQGMDVITTLEGRSPRTHELSRQAGLRNLPSLREVVRASDLFISVVHPDSAESLAGHYLDVCGQRPQGQIFIDANSVSPASIVRMAERLASEGVAFVDAALVGPASHLGTTSTIYLSGPRAPQVAECIGPNASVRILGQTVGEASSLKMLLGGMNKGIAALFFELALVAAEMGSLSGFLTEYRANYPAVMSLIERMAPTYARHSRRRGEEMREVERMIRSLGLEPQVVRGARSVIELIASLDLEVDKTADDLVRQISHQLNAIQKPAQFAAS